MNRYQDYVIKDGKFVGKFEEMYQDFQDPWHQIEMSTDSYSRLVTPLTLNRIQAKNVLEVGCGLGMFTDYLTKSCTQTKFTGMDISATAISKAKASFPNIEFICGNIKDIDSLINSTDVSGGGTYDCIIFAEIMWYILQDLDDIISQLKKYYHGYLIVNQVFYKGQQKYGCDYFTTLDEMIDYLPFKLMARLQSDTLSEDTVETHSLYKINL